MVPRMTTTSSASLLMLTRLRRSCSVGVILQLQRVSARSFHRSVGIVGMPNVGKSTLFNALTKTENAQAANYPFCTIDPNIARVAVPDERVHRLAEIEKSQKVIETQVCVLYQYHLCGHFLNWNALCLCSSSLSTLLGLSVAHPRARASEISSWRISAKWP